MLVLAERQIRSGHLSALAVGCSGLQRGITIAQLHHPGPGFLACHLLKALPNVHMVLLDFSAAMHELAKQRLGPLVSGVEFVEGSFKDRAWSGRLTQFDAVVTHQAVHELRHKQYALDLHKHVKAVLRPRASYLVCDHFFGPDGMSNDQLYMTVGEQKAAIESAGYLSVRQAY
jgi:ubiquinone/menaquinone biosynthesis C-methylase UbiE